MSERNVTQDEMRNMFDHCRAMREANTDGKHKLLRQMLEQSLLEQRKTNEQLGTLNGSMVKHANRILALEKAEAIRVALDARDKEKEDADRKKRAEERDLKSLGYQLWQSRGGQIAVIAVIFTAIQVVFKFLEYFGISFPGMLFGGN